ncbi:co-chaperone GroES [Candidatus Parcubacteria bacterium]|jgi:chaperonin GroES|nr:co-chaperone GroES [Candidatus Parcubacteria bacterium]MBT7227911.1 co-chaperone GroES [Candidatus Parcubacteria bacterium]
MNLKPLGDRIIVKPLAKEEVTKSGIILPESATKESRKEGEIVVVGTGENIAKLRVKKGNRVIFSEYGGSDINVDGEDYKILNHDDLLAVDCDPEDDSCDF